MAEQQWFYSVDGERKGPVSEDAIVGLVKAGKLDAETAVWQTGWPDWKNLSTTTLSIHLANDPNIPPPLTGDKVNNSIVWALAFAPWLGLVIQGMVSSVIGLPANDLWLITLFLNIALCTWDGRKLVKAGHKGVPTKWTWLVPVYLYKRARLLKQNLAYFIVWWVTFVLSLFA